MAAAALHVEAMVSRTKFFSASKPGVSQQTAMRVTPSASALHFALLRVQRSELSVTVTSSDSLQADRARTHDDKASARFIRHPNLRSMMGKALA